MTEAINEIVAKNGDDFSALITEQTKEITEQAKAITESISITNEGAATTVVLKTKEERSNLGRTEDGSVFAYSVGTIMVALAATSGALYLSR